MLLERIYKLDYIDDYENEITEQKKYGEIYEIKCNEISKKTNINIVCQTISAKVLYKKYLNNLQRKSSKIKYDWVFKTRFDVGFCMNTNLTHAWKLWNNLPEIGKIYTMPDIFSAGSEEIIDIESDMYKHYPYILNDMETIETIKNMCTTKSHTTIETYDEIKNWFIKWAAAPESNLIIYYKKNNMKICYLHYALTILISDANGELYEKHTGKKIKKKICVSFDKSSTPDNLWID